MIAVSVISSSMRAGSQRVLRENLADHINETRVAELHRRQVLANTGTCKPATSHARSCWHAARMTLFANGSDQSGFLPPRG